MADVGVAATQMTCSWDRAENLNRAEKLVRQAASAGASIILIQELFETPYFPIEQCHKHRSLACSLKESKAVKRFSDWQENSKWYCLSVSLKKPVRCTSIRLPLQMLTEHYSVFIGNHTFQMPRDTKKKSTSVPAIPDFASGGRILAM